MSAEQPQEAQVTLTQDKKRIYIRWDVTGETLRSAFEKFGNITESRVVPNQRIKPFGFVTFNTEEEAAAALAGMQGCKLTTETAVVEYASGADKPKPRRNRRPNNRRPRRAPPADGAGADGAATPAAATPAADGAAPKPRRARQPNRRRRGPRKQPAAGGEPAAAAAADNAATPAQ